MYMRSHVWLSFFISLSLSLRKLTQKQMNVYWTHAQNPQFHILHQIYQHQLTSSKVTVCATANKLSCPWSWFIIIWPRASLSIMNSRLSTEATLSTMAARCSLSFNKADKYLVSSPFVTPNSFSRRTCAKN